MAAIACARGAPLAAPPLGICIAPPPEFKSCRPPRPAPRLARRAANPPQHPRSVAGRVAAFRQARRPQPCRRPRRRHFAAVSGSGRHSRAPPWSGAHIDPNQPAPCATQNAGLAVARGARLGRPRRLPRGPPGAAQRPLLWAAACCTWLQAAPLFFPVRNGPKGAASTSEP